MLANFIKEKRPNISDTSIKTYCSLLRTLYKKVFPEDNEFDADKFTTHKKDVMEILKHEIPNKRKTKLAAIVVITDDKDYRAMMLDDLNMVRHQTEKQEMTDTQKENWLSEDLLKLKYEELKKDATTLFKRENLTSKELQRIQNYILLCLYSGQFIEPRRALDYTAMKIKSIDNEKDNYIDMKTKKFVFHQFKTVKSKGVQSMSIPNELMIIIRKWLKINTNDTFLIDNRGKPLNSVTLNQRLNQIFDGKKISINAFRHTYLTKKFGNTLELNKQIAETMDAMGSSSNMLQNYVKHT